jgi:hypothetical protein
MPTIQYCLHCDASISPVASFCDQCGHELPITRNTIPLQPHQISGRISPVQQLTLVNLTCTIIIITLTAYHWLAASSPDPVPMTTAHEALIAPEPSQVLAVLPTGLCTDTKMYPKYYRKYEADSNAELVELPAPKLTPDAIAHKDNAVGTMRLELILAPCGVMDHIVFRGYMPYGLAVMAEKAAKQITFRPALVNGQPVPQQVTVEYMFYACDPALICTDAREVVE